MADEPRIKVRIKSDGYRGATVVEAWIDGEWRSLPGVTDIVWQVGAYNPPANDLVARVTLTTRAGIEAEGELAELLKRAGGYHLAEEGVEA